MTIAKALLVILLALGLQRLLYVYYLIFTTALGNRSYCSFTDKSWGDLLKDMSSSLNST